MRITKDEAYLLAVALEIAKFELGRKDFDHETFTELFRCVSHLETRLTHFSKDKRRQGRTTLNDYHDVLRRFIKNENKLYS